MNWHALFVILSALTLVMLLSRASSWAHDWYPSECCNGHDCAPVEKVTWFDASDGTPPLLIVTSKYGTVRVPHEFPRRESKDGRMHICIQGPYVLCLFMPPPL